MSDDEESDLKLLYKNPTQITRKLRKYGIAEFNGFDEYFKVFDEGIKNKNIKAKNRENIEEMTTNVKNAIDTLIAKIPGALVNKINNEYKDYGSHNSMHVSKYLKYLHDNLDKNQFNSIIKQLDNFSFISFPKDKEIFIGIDKNAQLKHLINSKNDGNHESEILIIEINTENEISINISNNIEIDSPRNLKETLIDFIENIKKHMNNLQKTEN